MDIEASLRALGAQMGLDLALDAEGQCTLVFDERNTVTLEKDGETLLLSGPVSDEDASRLDSCALSHLLQACWLGARTGGCALAISPADGRLTAWTRCSGGDLQETLEGFLAALDGIRESLPELLGQAGDAAGNAGSEAPSLLEQLDGGGVLIA